VVDDVTNIIESVRPAGMDPDYIRAVWRNSTVAINATATHLPAANLSALTATDPCCQEIADSCDLAKQRGNKCPDAENCKTCKTNTRAWSPGVLKRCMAQTHICHKGTACLKDDPDTSHHDENNKRCKILTCVGC
jgi:hypothetical protein